MPVLDYPAWCSLLEQAVIEETIEAQPLGPTGRPVFGRMYPSEAAAIAAIVAVSEVIVATLTASRPCPSPEARAAGISELVERWILAAALYRPQPATPLNHFIPTVRRALAACPWWPAPETPSTPLVAPPRVPDAPVDERPPLSLPKAAKQLGVDVDTIVSMEERGEIRTVAIGKRRKVPVAEVERVLTNAVFRFRHNR